MVRWLVQGSRQKRGLYRVKKVHCGPMHAIGTCGYNICMCVYIHLICFSVTYFNILSVTATSSMFISIMHCGVQEKNAYNTQRLLLLCMYFAPPPPIMECFDSK